MGKFANGHEDDVTAHFGGMDPAIRVVGLAEIVDTLAGLATRQTYTDDPVIMTVKALAAAGRLDSTDGDT